MKFTCLACPILLVAGLVAGLDECNWVDIGLITFADTPLTPETVILVDGGYYFLGNVKNVATGFTESTVEVSEFIGKLEKGAIENMFRIVGMEGGTMTAQTANFKCTVKFGPFIEGQYMFYSSGPTDFYNSAVQMAGGSPSVGEYFIDIDNSPIHLKLDATTDKLPSENWIVTSSGAPAHLDTDPTVVNPNYTPANMGKMITSEEWTAIGTLYSIDGEFYVPEVEYAWLPGDVAPLPFVDAAGGHPYGNATRLEIKHKTMAMVDAYSGAATVFSWTPINLAINPPAGPEPTPLPPLTTTTRAPKTTTIPTTLPPETTTLPPVTGSGWIVGTVPVAVLCFISMI